MIFLIDDDPIQNLLTSQLIENANLGREFRIFNNGLEALDIIKSGVTPSVILLDINMPIMDGWEFLEHYTKEDTAAEVYILTSSSSGIDLAKADQFACVKGYYTKPINIYTIKGIFESDG